MEKISINELSGFQCLVYLTSELVKIAENVVTGKSLFADGLYEYLFTLNLLDKHLEECVEDRRTGKYRKVFGHFSFIHFQRLFENILLIQEVNTEDKFYEQHGVFIEKGLFDLEIVTELVNTAFNRYEETLTTDHISFFIHEMREVAPEIYDFEDLMDYQYDEDNPNAPLEFFNILFRVFDLANIGFFYKIDELGLYNEDPLTGEDIENEFKYFCKLNNETYIKELVRQIYIKDNVLPFNQLTVENWGKHYNFVYQELNSNNLPGEFYTSLPMCNICNLKDEVIVKTANNLGTFTSWFNFLGYIFDLNYCLAKAIPALEPQFLELSGLSCMDLDSGNGNNALSQNLKSKGRPAHSVKECIIREDKEAVIQEMKEELAKRPNGPSKAAYLNELYTKGVIVMFPPYKALKKEELIDLSESAWNSAMSIYR